MNASLGSTWGTSLGVAYIVYALVLLMGCLGPHLLLLLAYVLGDRRERATWALLTMELVYGLLNPVVYLLVFEPALLRAASTPWLQGLSWSLLTAYWGVRLLGASSPLSRERLRLPVRFLLLGCMGLILALGVRDLLQALRPDEPFTLQPLVTLPVVFVGPLYFFTFTIAVRQYRRTGDSETWARFTRFFLPAPLSRGVAGACVLGVLVLGAATLWRPSEEDTREMLLAHREDILAASAQANIDPRVIASIVFVTHREHTTPLRSALEEGVAHAWLTDEGSHALLGAALNPSLGLTQIKPKTVLTAIYIFDKSGGTTGFYRKHLRDIPLEGDAYRRIPIPALVRVRAPRGLGEGRKHDVVEALLEPARNLALCGFLLDLYATQWETAQAGWSIRQRPEILATLYQIGFERSFPKAAPQANDFGRRVLQLQEDPWMREHFATSCP